MSEFRKGMIQGLASVAGLVAFVTLAGGALLWLRFDQAHLPADQAVAVVPRELLVIVGVHALFVPIAVGTLAALAFAGVSEARSSRLRATVCLAVLGGVLVAVVAFVVAEGWDSLIYTLPAAAWIVAVIVFMVYGSEPWQLWTELADADGRQTFLCVCALAVLGTVGAIFIALRVRDLDYVWWLFVGGVGLASMTVLTFAALIQNRGRAIAGVAFAACVITGAALAFARTGGAPKLEPLALKLTDGTTIVGFQVARTSDRFVIAPLPDKAFMRSELRYVLQIPADKVERWAVRAPEGTEFDDEGRARAAALRDAIDPRSKRVRAVTTANPIATFAPVVSLHSRERWWPMDANGFLRRSTLLWAEPKEGCDFNVVLEARVESDDPQPTGAVDAERLGDPQGGYVYAPVPGHCRRATDKTWSATEFTRPFASSGEREGFYLDLDDDHRRGRAPGDRRVGQQRLMPTTPVYWESSRRGRTLRVTYWFFYGFSQPPGPEETKHLSHEGDWERMSVVLKRQDRRKWLPVTARLHSHNGSDDYPWYALDRVATRRNQVASHPVVYSALGSHATYPQPETYPQDLRAGDRTVLTVHDRVNGCAICPQWQTWERLVAAKRQPWYGFGGAWGDTPRGIAARDRTGPLGPSPYKPGWEN